MLNINTQNNLGKLILTKLTVKIAKVLSFICFNHVAIPFMLKKSNVSENITRKSPQISENHPTKEDYFFGRKSKDKGIDH
jgi:hypothetical protein